MKDDHYWMAYALKLAQQAQQQDEVPVGAVIVRGETLIGEGFNQAISSNDPTAHAEIVALRSASAYEKNYRLPGTTLYCTLEPCIMCAGAIVHARVDRLVYAATEPKTGAAGSCIDVFNIKQLNHRLHCDHGILAQESSDLIRGFFRSRR